MEFAEHQKTILSRLLQSESWRIVMHIFGERLAYYEKQLRQVGLDRELRLIMLERRNEVLDMVQRFYHRAGQDNPFNEAAGVLWATDLRLPELVIDPAVAEAIKDIKKQAPKRQAGSIA